MLTSHWGDKKRSVNELKQFRLKKNILKCLYENTATSSPELSRSLGITVPTTILLLNDLIGKGWIIPVGPGISSGGRKPSLYGLSGESLFVITCELGRYLARLAVINSRNEFVTAVSTVQTNIDDHRLVEKLFEETNRLISEYQIPLEKILGLGVGMPGMVDADMGMNYSVREKAYQNVRERFEQTFRMDVYVDNDARMQAFGEFISGKAKGCRNALVINWSWGIGLGMILNNTLYKGNNGFAGEFSHIRLIEEGELCLCGKRGCLETAASTEAILKMARIGIQNDAVSCLTRRFRENMEEMTPGDIISAAKGGDEFSISLLSKAAMVLGKGISYLIQILNPEIIVLAGPVARAAQFVLIPIKQALNQYCPEPVLKETPVVVSEMDENAGLLGVGAKFYKRIFSDTSG